MQPETPGQDPEAPRDPVAGRGCPPVTAAGAGAAGGLVVSWGGDADLGEILAAMGLRERRLAGLDIPGWDEPDWSEPAAPVTGAPAGQAGASDGASDPLADGMLPGDCRGGDVLA